MVDSYRDLIVGLLTALVSALILGGSLSLAMAEDQTSIALNPTHTSTATKTNSPTPLPTLRPGDPTFTASVTEAPTNTPSPSNTPTPEPTKSTSCNYPSGWVQIVVNTGDTLESLASTYNTSSDAIREANCLLVDSLAAGSEIYVPQVTLTATFIHCGPPVGWILYIIQAGDNLFQIGLAHGVTVAQLQAANCMGASTYIRAGQKLFVPYVAISTSTSTPTSTLTPTPTQTNTLLPATATFTATTAATASVTTTIAATATQTNTATDSPTFTTTATSTETPAPSATDVPTQTPSPTSSPIPSPTFTSTGP